MFRKIVSMLLVSLLVISFVGCGEKTSNKEQTDNSSPKVDTETASKESDLPDKITVICTTDDIEFFQYVAEDYTAQYGVNVEFVSQSYDDTHTKITTTWSGRGDGDICYVDIPWAAEFGDLGLTMGLDEYMTDEYKDGLIASSLNQLRYKDQTYAVPFCNNGKWMFYNKAMLEEAGHTEPPKTWEGLKEVSEDLIEKGIAKYGIAWGAAQAEGLMCDLTTLIYGFGGKWQNDDGSFAFNSSESADAIQFVVDSMKNGWADPASITYTDRDCLDPFLAGDTAFCMNWGYVYSYGNDEANSQVAGNVDICLMPGTDAAVSSSVTGGGGLGVMSTSKSPEYAWKFIEMVTSLDNQKYALDNYSILPTLTVLYTDEAILAENESLGKFYPQYETAHPRPALPNYSEWSNNVQPIFSAAMTGELTPSDALQQAYDVSKDFE